MKRNKRNMNNAETRTGNMLNAEYIILFLVIVFFCLGFVRVKVEQIKVGYEISENSKLEKELLQTRQNLKAEYMQLRSPERMEYLAENLGFKFPTQNDVIFVETATVVGNIK